MRSGREQVLIVDDVLATGETARAVASLVEQVGGEIVGLSFLLDLGLPGGRAGLHHYRVAAAIQ
jgi:adenine phosphoribosyltransferase